MNEWHICTVATNNSYFDELAMHSVTVYRSVYFKYCYRPEVPNLCSAEPTSQGLRGRGLLVVVENKLRYYGKFQSF